MLRQMIARLSRGRSRAARAVHYLRRRPFLDIVEPADLDIRLWIDPADRFQLEIWAGAYQTHVVGWLRRTVRPGDRVLCVGLHVGYIAGVCRRLAGPGGAVFSAEPDPAARTLAQRNANLADARDAPLHVFAGGLGAAPGTESLYQSRVAGHSSFAGPHQNVGRVDVPVTTGDAFLTQHGVGALDVLVLDVEGWEQQVLAGLAGTVARSPQLHVCYEATLWALREAGASPEMLHTWFGARGFAVAPLGGDDWTATRDHAARK